MSLLDLPRMLVSPQGGWNALARIHPSIAKLFCWLVLPCSLVPPLLIEYTGSHYGMHYFPAVDPGVWPLIAGVFLLAELLTVPLMAWAINSVAHTRGVASSYHSAFTVAAVAAIPLWLSALALLLQQPLLVVVAVLIGLEGSIRLIYFGVERFLQPAEELETTSITYTTISLGICAWALLIAIVLLPILFASL